MLSFNYSAGARKSPLVVSLFVQHWIDAGINPPPPGTGLRITDDGSYRITDAGDYRITD